MIIIHPARLKEYNICLEIHEKIRLAQEIIRKNIYELNEGKQSIDFLSKIPRTGSKAFLFICILYFF